MKNRLNSIVAIVALVAFLLLTYFGIQHFQSPGPAPLKLVEGGKPERTISSPSDNKVVEKKNVDLQFEDGSKVISYKEVPLYSVVKEDQKPISITADGEMIKQVIEKLPQPEKASEPVPSKLVKSVVSNFDKLVRGSSGLDIDKEKTLAAVEEAIKNSPEAATLTIKILTKKIEGKESFSNKKNAMGFKTLITSFSTLHEGHMDDKGRNVNLAIAAKKIDGVIIPPGGKFSFDKVVGPRTAKYGFQKAGVISRGKVIPGMGGGICQVSTTLYQTILEAGLKVDERHNHSIYDGIDYAKRGLDAAIAWGYKDLKFRNNLDFPILISAKSGMGSVSIELFAEKVAFDSVVLVTRNEKKHPFQLKKKKNRKLGKGQEKIVHPGVVGYSIETYRIITKDGKSKEERMSKDRYLTFNRIVEFNN